MRNNRTRAPRDRATARRDTSALAARIVVAFLMWNATYPVVIANPRRYRAVFLIVLAQQAIGLVGETAILLGLPAGHEVLAASILRFIAFDAAGFIAMLAAFAALQLRPPRTKDEAADQR